MQYEAKNSEEYLNMLEEDWRKEKLLLVREIILENAPELEEGIQYKMLCYREGASTLFHLNAQKSYVSLYVGNVEKIENAKELLSGLDYGKGCIRIKKSVDLNKSGLEGFIQSTLSKWREGGNLDC
ncbi:iron chaperone [Bacillus sp. 2205SS5-2]|uniref:iron chaperone n=1 Tax=Bacillus sp. 2205SS5-2 TaxID=3109031 RepID=UPI00300769E1